MDARISQLMQMQRSLYKIHEDSWSPLEPEYGRDFLLFMVEEMGEVISVLKKKGDRSVIDDPNVRSVFLEEMSDVLMYYMDTLLRYQVSAEELSDAYINKHKHNMGRNYTKEYEEYITNGKS